MSHKTNPITISWTAVEQLEIDTGTATKWRRRARIEKRLLHNRTATSLNKHALLPFDQTTNIQCEVCQKSTSVSNLTKFLKETCGGEIDGVRPTNHRQARASVQFEKRQKLVKGHNAIATQFALHTFRLPVSADDPLICDRCHSQDPEGWKRFLRHSKRKCYLAPV